MISGVAGYAKAGIRMKRNAVAAYKTAVAENLKPRKCAAGGGKSALKLAGWILPGSATGGIPDSSCLVLKLVHESSTLVHSKETVGKLEFLLLREASHQRNRTSRSYGSHAGFLDRDT